MSLLAKAAERLPMRSLAKAAERLPILVFMASAGACATAPVAPTAETVRSADVAAWWPCAPEALQGSVGPGFETCRDAARYGALLRQLQNADGPDPRAFLGEESACALPFEVHGCSQRQTFICHGQGVCAPLTERTAYAASDAECRALGQCKRFGECALGPEHSCHANAEADCLASSEACAIMGRCQLDREERGALARDELDPRGWCVARDQAACAGAAWCRDLGRCEASDGACVAGDEAGCRASTECRTRQRCWPRDGICVNEPPRPPPQ